MAKPYWFRQHNGFQLDTKGVNTEELKRINARLAGREAHPTKSRQLPEVIGNLLLPNRYVPLKKSDASPLDEALRETRLDYLQEMGEIALASEAA
ncbi:MAG TPA: hypothetical protein VLF88_00575 [Candidatus Babeliales bacterium]|nr:hypothetical protein [Candidatus Babeliales bacterium]